MLTWMRQSRAWCKGGYSYSGQICISVQRVYAHESIAASFSDKLVSAVTKLRVGHPREDTTQIASLVSEPAARRVEEWVQDAARAGGKVLTGGKRTNATIEPGVLADVPESARLMQEELFGPMVAVNRYTRSGSTRLSW